MCHCWVLKVRFWVEKSILSSNCLRTSITIKDGTSMGTMYFLNVRTELVRIGSRAIKLPVIR